MNYRIFPIGENALTVDFGNEISAPLNDRTLALADYIGKNRFRGFVEIVTAYSSLTIFYDLIEVRRSFPQFPTAFSAVRDYLESALENSVEIAETLPAPIEIPICYDEEYAPDLEFVADRANTTVSDAIKIHARRVYRVFMIGFLPAFPYMGEIDRRIACPRRSSPRLEIEKGSVGIAGKQTGIYPFRSPGGWRIVGRTPVEMFRPQNPQISFLQTGDRVKFYEITKHEYESLKRR